MKLSTIQLNPTRFKVGQMQDVLDMCQPSTLHVSMQIRVRHGSVSTAYQGTTSWEQLSTPGTQKTKNNKGLYLGCIINKPHC